MDSTTAQTDSFASPLTFSFSSIPCILKLCVQIRSLDLLLPLQAKVLSYFAKDVNPFLDEANMENQVWVVVIVICSSTNHCLVSQAFAKQR